MTMTTRGFVTALAVSECSRGAGIRVSCQLPFHAVKATAATATARERGLCALPEAIYLHAIHANVVD
jgi:hypothetical protein